MQRVLGLLTDEINPCGVDELLVVTFTNAAAGEMRQRIGDALGIPCRIADAPTTCAIRGMYKIMSNPDDYAAAFMSQRTDAAWR